MGTIIEPFTQEQSRALINLEQRYQVWILAEQKLLELPYNLARKEVKGHVYLYEVTDRRGNARSLGRVAGQVGMVTLARVACDVAECAGRGDTVAAAATWARLERISDRSLVAAWDMQDISV